jgi:hypothetical protein
MSSADWEEIRKINKETAAINKETAAINKETANMIKDVDKQLKLLEKLVHGYIGNDAKAIEEEGNTTFAKYLQRKFQKCNIYKCTGWKTLQDNMQPKSGTKVQANESSITEFDGLYVVSQNSAYFADDYIQKPYNPELVGSGPTFFVVLEAKHHITASKVNDKVAQMLKFKKYISDSSQYNPSVHTKEYLNKIVRYSLTEVTSDIIHIVFTSPYLTTECVEYIKQNYDQWIKQGVYVSYMKPAGNTYFIAWGDTGFKDEDVVCISQLKLKSVSGGRKNAVTKPVRKHSVSKKVGSVR